MSEVDLKPVTSAPTNFERTTPVLSTKYVVGSPTSWNFCAISAAPRIENVRLDISSLW